MPSPASTKRGSPGSKHAAARCAASPGCTTTSAASARSAGRVKAPIRAGAAPCASSSRSRPAASSLRSCRGCELPFVSRPAGSRGDRHPAGRRRSGRAARDAVLDRQGQLRPAPPRAQGVPPRPAAVPAAPRRHDVEVPGDVRVSASGSRRSRTSSCSCTSTEDGLAQGIGPFTHGSAVHTDVMKTEALKQALDLHGFDAAIGGARRDEERSRAKERIFSFRSAQHRWDPKSQRPELWRLYNARKRQGESIRVFPLSNWTELDVWHYIHREQIPIVPLYLARERPVVERDGTLIMVDDERMPLAPGEEPMLRKVRFRTLGCYPLSGAVESEAETLAEIIQEMLDSTVVGAAGAADRLRQPGVDGEEEAGGLLLRPSLRTARRSTRQPYLQEREHKPAALHHVRQRRRRQEHADRAGCSTSRGALRRPARGARRPTRSASARRAASSTSRSCSTGWRPSASRASRSTSPTASSRPSAGTFIVADTPGHEQYTRNMVTGASTADCAVILVDARKGVLTQTRRHSFLVRALGIRHVALAVTKMDLVDYSRGAFGEIERDYRELAAQLGPRRRRPAFPSPALRGDNVVERSDAMPWYDGPTLMEYLETRRGRPGRGCDAAVPAAGAVGEPARLRLPRLRRHRSPAGVVRPGDRVASTRRGRESTVDADRDLRRRPRAPRSPGRP